MRLLVAQSGSVLVRSVSIPYLVGLSFSGIKGVNLAEICRDAPSPFRNAEQF